MYALGVGPKDAYDYCELSKINSSKKPVLMVYLPCSVKSNLSWTEFSLKINLSSHLTQPIGIPYLDGH